MQSWDAKYADQYSAHANHKPEVAALCMIGFGRPGTMCLKDTVSLLAQCIRIGKRYVYLFAYDKPVLQSLLVPDIQI